MKAIPDGHLLCHYLYAFFVHCVLALTPNSCRCIVCVFFFDSDKVIACKIVHLVSNPTLAAAGPSLQS
jgi:hypothetical protein